MYVSFKSAHPIAVLTTLQGGNGQGGGSPYPNYGGGGSGGGGEDGSGGEDPYNNIPDTGVVRRYNWEISRGQLAPDGFLKDGIFINGGYPGPVLEANWGDTFEITIHNNISGPEEGTSLHWHGINQKGTPWFDGVPGASQCPIAPGSSFTYRFKADQYGTSWYHAHYSAQYTDGIFGPMVIYGPKHEEYDIDIGPVLLVSVVKEVLFCNTDSCRMTITTCRTTKMCKRLSADGSRPAPSTT